MNILILLLTFSIAFAETDPVCIEVSKMVVTLEKDLMSKFVKDLECKDITPQQIKKLLDDKRIKNNEEPYPLDNDSDAIALFNKHRCSNLALIDSEIDRLRNEESLLAGFDKLKFAIANEKKNVGETYDEKAIESGKKFVDHLQTAQTMELLFSTQVDDIFTKIKKAEFNENTKADEFKTKVAEFCKDTQGKPIDSSGTDICNPALFKPNDASVKALVVLINNLSGDPKADKVTIEKWALALKIKKKGSKADEDSGYSFNQMQEELFNGIPWLRGDKNKSFTRNELRVISKLDQFENGDSLPFLNELHSSSKDIITPKLRFKAHIQDLANRQFFEFHSKLSLAWSSLDLEALGLTDDETKPCKSFNNVHEGTACLKSLKSIIETKLIESKYSNLKKDLTHLTESLDISKTYIQKLEENEGQCFVDSTTMEQIATCYTLLNAGQAKARNKINALNLLKQQINVENEDALLIRDYAMERLSKCKTSSKNELEFCEVAYSDKISNEAFILSNDTMAITTVYKPKSGTEEKMKALCGARIEGEKNKEKNALCRLLEENKTDVVVAGGPNPDTIMGPNDVAFKNAKVDIIGGLADIFGDLMRPKPAPSAPPFNPYPTMQNAPFRQEVPLHMQILAPHVYMGGAGMYAPVSPYF